MAKTETKKPKPAAKPVTSNGKKEVDEMMVGFYFGESKFEKDKTPYDYAPNAEGVDPRSNVWGVRRVDLTDGIEGAVLPPLGIWKLGEWIQDMPKHEQPLQSLTKAQQYPLWCVPGIGAPGNYDWAVYKVPTDVASDQIPKHPMLWLPSQKEGKYSHLSEGVMNPRFSASHTGFTSYKPVSAVPSTPTTTAPKLPTGVRIRCPGCGHWFKETDLKAHPQLCPGAASNDGYSDWAVMCAAECGCRTLDDASTCKPGFPRPKKEVKTVSTTEEEPTPEEEGTAEAEKPAEDAPAEEEGTTSDS